MAAPRIFVSHSHQDNDYCRRFVAALRERGYDVWYDEHDLGSGALRDAIDRELLSRQHFIVIFSPAALQSSWVKDEMEGALKLFNSGKMQTFLPIVAVKCEVPPTLERYRRVEGPNGEPVSVEEAVARAMKALPSVVASSFPPQSPSRSSFVTPTPSPYSYTPPAPNLNPARSSASYPQSEKIRIRPKFQWLASIGALTFLIAAFLPWFGYSYSFSVPGPASQSISGSVNAWYYWAGTLGGVVSIAVLLLIFVRILVNNPPRFILRNRLILIASGMLMLLSSIIYLARIGSFSYNGAGFTFGPSFGIFIAILASLIVIVGSFMQS